MDHIFNTKRSYIFSFGTESNADARATAEIGT